MNIRLPLNKNESIYELPSYQGLHVINHRGPLVEGYLEDIFRTIECALADYPKLFAFRIDLRLPKDSDGWLTNIISRFTDSFKEQIKAYLKQKDMRDDLCKPRFIWAKECQSSKNIHYHLIVLLNKDVFFRSGRIDSDNVNLAKRVEKAWATALDMDLMEVIGLVEFPANRDYIVNRYSAQFLQQLTNLFYRASYLAKADTKQYRDGTRHFSTSHFTALPMEFSLDELIMYHKYNLVEIEQEEYLMSEESRQYRDCLEYERRIEEDY